MSRPHLHVDAISGLAGDMFAAAALAADLVERTDLERLLTGLGLGTIRVESDRVRRGAFAARHLRFEGWDSEHDRRHRHLNDVVDLLEKADLEPGVRDRAVRMFRRLGEAEASVHGVALEEVHFHEVGAVDSILDVVSAAWIVESTDADWSVGSISVGSGTTETEHGPMPLPVPASAELLRGFQLRSLPVEAELITPTGAVILRTLQAEGRLGGRPAGRLAAVGYGAGTRDLDDWPNVVRLTLFDQAPEGSGGAGSVPSVPTERVVRLACEMDDVEPEVASHLADRLAEEGALDVVREPVTMKKGRLGVRLTLLCRASDEGRMVEVLFAESTTLGIRRDELERYVLDRETVEVETSYGPVRVKLGYRGGDLVQSAPEFESCRRAADRHDAALRSVYRAALHAFDSSRRSN